MSRRRARSEAKPTITLSRFAAELGTGLGPTAPRSASTKNVGAAGDFTSPITALAEQKIEERSEEKLQKMIDSTN